MVGPGLTGIIRRPPAAERVPGVQVNIKRFDAFQGASPCNQAAALGGQRFAGDLPTWMAGGAAHPLAHYTLRSWLPYWAGQGKCMVHPDHMAAYQVCGLALTLKFACLALLCARCPAGCKVGMLKAPARRTLTHGRSAQHVHSLSLMHVAKAEEL